MRSARYSYRYLSVLLHLLSGVITVGLLFPFLDRSERDKRLSRWSARLLAVVGMRVVVQGRSPAIRAGGALLVANHVSWLDIHLIHSLLPARFVSKAEVRDWPIIGWLADKGGRTLFLERTRKADARRMNALMAGHMQDGDCLALFPEGTTSAGETVLPFFPSLFQPAIDAEITVYPTLIRYLDEAGKPSSVPAYYGEMSLLESMHNILGASGQVIEITFLPALAARGQTRRELAKLTESAIRAALAGDTNDSQPERAPRLQSVSH